MAPTFSYKLTIVLLYSHTSAGRLVFAEFFVFRGFKFISFSLFKMTKKKKMWSKNEIDEFISKYKELEEL